MNANAAHQELLIDFAVVQEQARDVFRAKNAAYGTRNIAESGEEGVLLRMTDKFARLRNKNIPGESIDDTLVDLMNYAAILLLLRQGKWPGQQQSVDNPDLRHALQVLEDEPHSLSAPFIEGDVGYDLRAAKDVTLPARQDGPIYVPTGVRIKAPEGTWTRIVGRSSTTKRGILVAEGVIDNGYTGELLVTCFNLSGRQVEILAGDRIAQLVFCPIITPKITTVEKLPRTGRGSKGFGSTGETIGSAAMAHGGAA